MALANGLHAPCDCTQMGKAGGDTHIAYIVGSGRSGHAFRILSAAPQRGERSRATRITRPIWGQTRCIESRHGHSGFAAAAL